MANTLGCQGCPTWEVAASHGAFVNLGLHKHFEGSPTKLGSASPDVSLRSELDPLHVC